MCKNFADYESLVILVYRINLRYNLLHRPFFTFKLSHLKLSDDKIFGEMSREAYDFQLCFLCSVLRWFVRFECQKIKREIVTLQSRHWSVAAGNMFQFSFRLEKLFQISFSNTSHGEWITLSWESCRSSRSSLAIFIYSWDNFHQQIVFTSKTFRFNTWHLRALNPDRTWHSKNIHQKIAYSVVDKRKIT